MPIISRTERQVSVNARPQPYDTSDTGAISRGIGAIGAGIGKLGEQIDEQEAFDTKMKVSEYTHRKSMEEDDRIANFNPAKHGPAADFDRTYMAEREVADNEFVGQFKSPRAKQMAALAVQQNRQASALRSQNARQSLVMQENVGKIEAYSARVGSTIDGTTDSITRGLQSVDGAIDEVPGLTPRQRNLLRGKAADQMWKSWAQKATPEQMEATLKQFEAGVDKWRKQFDDDEPTSQATSGPLREVDRTDTRLRQGGAIKPRAVVFHHTSGTTAEGAIDTLRKRGLSYNYLIEPDGTVVTLVPGGKSSFHMKPDEHGRGFTNDDTIGISFVARNAGAVTEKQLAAGRALAARDAERFGISHSNVYGHGEVNGHKESDEGLAAARAIRSGGWGSQAKAQPQSSEPPLLAQRGIAQVAGHKAPAPADDTRALDEPGTLATKRERLALPERATMGDHAINEFMQIRPFVMKRLEEERAKRAGLEWAAGVMEGRTEFNPNDGEGRKFIDQTIGQTDLGKRVFSGDPEALIVAGQLSDRMKYVPKPIYDGLKGLIDHQDPKRQAMGWTAINNLYARNPNIFNTHGDDKAIVQQAEYVQRLSRLHGMDKALKIIAAEKDPDAKIHKKATEADVAKFMKGYDGATTESQIAKDMDEGWWPFSRPSLAYDHRQKSRAITDYKDMLKRHYEATGDETKAKAYAASEFKQSYGVSMVMGERVMPYPPERFYPPVEGKHSYIEDEIKKLVGTYSPSAKMETVRLIADGRTAQDAAQGRPTYLIRVERKDGREEVLPGRFVPDVRGAMGGLKEKFDKKRGDDLLEIQRQRDNPPPSLGDMMVP